MYMYIVKRYDWVSLAKNQNMMVMVLMVLHDLMLLDVV